MKSTNNIEIGTSVYFGSFSGFVACFFMAHDELYAKVSSFDEKNYSTCAVSSLTIIG